ncbi:MAG: succinate--CoA ligase subunit alpha [archaeon]
MAILVDRGTRALVQGITGKIGLFQTQLMIKYGTNVVAGVTPGKGGESVGGIPVFDSVYQAVEKTNPEVSICFVPGPYAADAAMEAIDAGLRLVVVVAEAVPLSDAVKMLTLASERKAFVLGPDTAGLISPGRSKLGVQPHRLFMEGRVGIVSRSGALSYETAKTLTENKIGQSTVIGLGGGPVWGFTDRDALQLFGKDKDTDAVVLLGEIGGHMEAEAAEFIKKGFPKPVIALIVGRTAPLGQKMGHAGAIVQQGRGSAKDKIVALREAGALIADSPREIPDLIRKSL